MCKVGDIIVIDNYNHDGINLSRHSFVVISDQSGKIQGIDYDLICNVMSSFKNAAQKAKKLSYPYNFPITHNDRIMQNGNNNEGYIKVEQFYYFDKLTINYKVIGALTPEVLEELITFINNINSDEINIIIDNLQF